MNKRMIQCALAEGKTYRRPANKMMELTQEKEEEKEMKKEKKKV